MDGGRGMTSWDIKPQGVQGQLKTVGGHAGDLSTALNAMLTDMSQAAQYAGTAVPGSAAETRLAGPVAAALGEYLKGRKPELESMTRRIEACVLGAVKATNEYIEGDLDQAKAAQDAARAMNLEALREQPGGKK